MQYPPLRQGLTPDEYRQHFERTYCRGVIATFDGVAVRFRKANFNHSFFESTRRDGGKDKFSVNRSERIDWIKTALQDSASELYQGWVKSASQYDSRRRVAVVMGNYVVVIGIKGPKNADFITAYLADTPAASGRKSTVEKIREGPKWA